MALRELLFFCLLLSVVWASDIQTKLETPTTTDAQEDDLKTAASNTYTRRYFDWNGYNNPEGYGFAGYGGDRYNSYYGTGYDNTLGYGSSGNSGYYPSYNSYSRGSGYNSGYGGYGGYGGNGGVNSYYGYNNPYYQGANHLGYGYYSKRPGYGSIYNYGVTPNLVTGYRGYTR